MQIPFVSTLPVAEIHHKDVAEFHHTRVVGFPCRQSGRVGVAFPHSYMWIQGCQGGGIRERRNPLRPFSTVKGPRGEVMADGKKRRILLVDDNAAIRHGLALMLTEEGVGECREAADTTEALEAATREQPDVALVDLSPDTEAALQLIAQFCSRNIPVLVCSMRENPSYVRQALAAGACGYITKSEAPRELTRAVCDVLEGWMLISPRAAEGLR